MSNNTPSVGTTFYLRRPTKAIIKKNSLKVEKYDQTTELRNRGWMPTDLKKQLVGIAINGVRFPSEWFNSTVLCMGDTAVGLGNDCSIAGFDNVVVMILDKERVTHKRKIVHLIGKKIRVPTILLRPKGEIIDIREIPERATECISHIVEEDMSLAIAERLNTDGRRLNPSELIASCRRNHVCNMDHIEKERSEIDLGIAKRLLPSVGNIGTRARVVSDSLQCPCGRAVGFKQLMQRLIDHRHKKRPKYKFTYTCSRCRTKYVISIENAVAQFNGVGKNKDKRLISFTEATGQPREAPRQLQTIRWENRVTRVLDVDEDEEEPW